MEDLFKGLAWFLFIVAAMNAVASFLYFFYPNLVSEPTNISAGVDAMIIAMLFVSLGHIYYMKGNEE